MSSPRPKSPRPPVSSKKDEKEESFWDKIGTLGRKKRIKEGIVLDSRYVVTSNPSCLFFYKNLQNALIWYDE